MKNKIMLKKKEEPKKLTKPFELSMDKAVYAAREIQSDNEELDEDNFTTYLSKSAAGFGYLSTAIKDSLDTFKPGELPTSIDNYWRAVADAARYTNGKVKQSIVRVKSTEYAFGIYELVINAIAQELGEKLFEELENNHYDILNNLQRNIYNAVAYGYPQTCCDYEIFDVVDEHYNGIENADGNTLNKEVMNHMLLPATIGAHNMTAELAIGIFDELYSISCLMVMKCPDFLDEITPYISDILNKSLKVSYDHIFSTGVITIYNQCLPFTTEYQADSIDS